MNAATPIIEQTAKCFGVSPRSIARSRRRLEPLATARKVAMVLVCEKVGSPSITGHLFARDGSTVSYALNTTDRAHIDAVKQGQKIVLKFSTPERKRLYTRRYWRTYKKGTQCD